MIDLLTRIAPFKYVLSEGAVIERLRRDFDIPLHPRLEHAMLIYDEKGRAALQEIYFDYMDATARAHVPILLSTPTWRANRERVIQGGAPASVNQDAAEFMQCLFRNGVINYTLGLMSCKNDCYKPEEALSRDEARRFHAWQIKSLLAGNVICVLAATLPNVEEACGIALAMQDAGSPGIISFVIDRNGLILDGNTLTEAISKIDAACDNPPLGYMLNCSYPSFFHGENISNEILSRIIGFGANASSLDHCDLDNADSIHTDSVSDWGDHLIKLHRNYNMKILGGCCGTDRRHLDYIVDNT